MDNSPTHDEAVLDSSTWTLDCEDVGLNSLIALDGEMLALVAAELGDNDTAARLEKRNAGLKARIRDELWDESRQVFANRLWSGDFVRSLAPTSFYPLLAGAATPAQSAAMVKLLSDPRKFGGDWLLPSVTRDDPAFGDNVYWRGRIWPPLNFLVYHGLKRSGFEAAARELADNSVRLFMGEWQAHRRCPENFSAVTGEACDQPDTDTFYGWGALMPALGVAEFMDVTPWGGWELTHRGDGSLGPIQAPGGRAEVESSKGVMTVRLNGQAVLRTNLTGRFRKIVLDGRIISLTIPAAPEGSDGDRWLEFPAYAGRPVLAARLGADEVKVAEGPDGLRIVVPAGTTPARLDLMLAESGDAE